MNATRRQVPASAACAAAEKSSAGEAGGTIFLHVDSPHLVTALEAQAAVGFCGSGINHVTCGPTYPSPVAEFKFSFTSRGRLPCGTTAACAYHLAARLRGSGAGGTRSLHRIWGLSSVPPCSNKRKV